ncbi:MAG: DUF192 domain-containing protein [Patescibacteria group bacterium]|jgi:uncharacterized membrane protein (UPF0127 family)|nr:DUF192 domain-containing protein [Patescibacteria group bacterium]
MQNKETKKIALVPRQKSFWPYLLISLVVIVLLIAGGWYLYKKSTETNYIKADINGQSYYLELADTDALRKRGLSERDGIKENGGMLFDFKQESDWRMWMVQMRFPIDIIWLNSDKMIVHIKNNATPAEYPEVYKSLEPSRYVIELPEDAVEKLKIKVGDNISF